MLAPLTFNCLECKAWDESLKGAAAQTKETSLIFPSFKPHLLLISSLLLQRPSRRVWAMRPKNWIMGAKRVTLIAFLSMPTWKQPLRKLPLPLRNGTLIWMKWPPMMKKKIVRVSYHDAYQNKSEKRLMNLCFGDEIYLPRVLCNILFIKPNDKLNTHDSCFLDFLEPRVIEGTNGWDYYYEDQRLVL